MSLSPSSSLKPLPIDGVLADLADALRSSPCVVLEAPPGAGKTTRVPPALLRSDGLSQGQIVVLEPRRIAARAAARRIADEQGWRLGEEVGYRIRFENRSSPQTRILVVTEGILVRMLQQDPFLEDVAAIIFDEFHERHLDSDLALAMALRVQRQVRDDLKMVVMSATLDAAPIAAYLDDCPVIESRGRSFPVDIQYLDLPDPRPLPTATAHAVRRVLPETSGHLLVFLPGVGEIRRCADLLKSGPGIGDAKIYQLYGDLPSEKQDAVLRSGTTRKVILATNVAETSITIDGVGAVVDSGWARSLRFDPAYGLDRLQLARISLASADQRAGRAGRQGPGSCLRLWTEHDHRSLLPHDVAEIRRLDLAAPLLQLYAWGEAAPRDFEWLESPEPQAIERAQTLLQDLGALHPAGGSRGSDGWTVNSLGRAMAKLAAHPRLARLLIEGQRQDMVRQAALAAALLAERDIVNRPTGQRRVVAMRSSTSDLVDRLDALEELDRSGYGETALGPVHAGRCRHVRRTAQHLERQLKRVHKTDTGPVEPWEMDTPSDLESDDEARLRRLLLAAFPDRVVKRREPGSRRGVMVGGRGARLSEMSAVDSSDLFLGLESDGGGRNRQDVLIRQASAIEMDWLPSEEIEQRLETELDAERGKVVGRRVTAYRDLVLHSVDVDPGSAEAGRVLAKAAAERWPEVLPQDDRELMDFLARLRSLAHWRPDLELPTFEEADPDLLATLCDGKRSMEALRRLPWRDMLEGTLDHRQRQALQRGAPSHLEVPSGSKIRLRYEPGQPPVLAVRIQELFGLDVTPTVAEGRQPVLLHLLAPNQRPQQVTHDLPSFWRNTYPAVRKELYGRYPKHAWPEDPLTASPETRPGRKGRRT